MHKFVRNLTRLQQVSLRPLFQGLSHSPVAPGPWTGKGSPSLCHVSTSAVARQDNAVRPQQPENSDPFQDKSIGLVQRFKKTLKQYGPVMIPVHLVTSSIWFGAFYYAAMKGVNVVPLLEHVGLPEKVVKLMEESQSGHAITALTLYKIATPARYTATLAGTSIAVRYLQKLGFMSTVPPAKNNMQDKVEDPMDRGSGKMDKTK